MKVHLLERRALPARLAVLCVPVAVSLVLPSAAMAASTGGSTLRAVVGADGAVKSVKLFGVNGAGSAYTGALPLKMSISRSVNGNSSTYTYDVENTFSKTQTVSYTDAQGKVHSASQSLQLPLIAQLGIELPSSFKDVTSPNGVVMTDPDGTNRLLFNLILFSPLGSPKQSAIFTATGSGVPTAELAASAVDPEATPGLSQAAQDANATSQQDDFWQGFSGGGNDGLTQLVTGMSALVAGLQQLAPGAHQLADGLKAAGTGAKQLDAGTASAYDGSKKLSGGIGDIHTGQSQLTTGLAQINGGLAQLADKHGKGLQAAVDGVKAIEAGVQQIVVGLRGVNGTVAAPTLADPAHGLPSVLLGLSATPAQIPPFGGVNSTIAHVTSQLQTDLGTLKALLGTDTGLQTLLGTDAAAATALNNVVTDLATNAIPAGALPGTPLANGGILVQLQAGLGQFLGAVQTITLGLSHPAGAAGAADPGGVDQGLLALLDPKAGLPAAVAGIDQLASGTGSALSGSSKLTAGSAEALTGSQTLASGLAQLAAGQHLSATGLPTAVSGAAQIAGGVDQVLAGAVKVHDGIGQVQTGAVTPLNTQLVTGSQNAKKQIAILEATAALAKQGPGGAGTTYVLTQSPNGFRLAASSSAASSGGSSHTGRNIGIGVGGLVVLVIAMTAGFALGRRSGATV